MRKFAFAVIAASIAGSVFATAAQAQRRPYSPSMNCGSVAQFVKMNGAAVIRTSPTTYDRYVAHRGFCTPPEITKAAWVPAIDTPACFVGYTCEHPVDRIR